MTDPKTEESFAGSALPRVPGKRGNPLSELGWGILWLIALALAGLAAAKIFAYDANMLLTWWNAYTFYGYLPIYAILLLSFWRQRWALVAVSLAIAGCHIAWIAPDFAPAAADYGHPLDGAKAEDRPQQVRLFFNNVYMHARDFDARMDEILRHDPDVVGLVEYTPWWHDAFIESGRLDDYPYNSFRPNNVFWGMAAIYSKYPLEEIDRLWVKDKLALGATVVIGSEKVRVYVLHSPRPWMGRYEKYRLFCERLLKWTNSETGPTIMMGDFNSTQHSRIIKRMLATRMQSAHSIAGRSLAVTWPNRTEPLPPIRIDHAFLSPEIRLLNIQEGDGGDSDHRPLILDVQIAQAATKPTAQ